MASLSALAAPVRASYCFRYKDLNQLDDHDVGVGSEFTSNFEKARGIKVEFDPRGTGPTLTRYAANSGSDAGCVTVDLEDAERYNITVYLESKRGSGENGVVVKMLEKDANSNWVVPSYLMTPAHGHAPADGQTYGPDGWAWPLETPITNVHAAANHATWRWDLGLSSGVVEIEIDPTSANCGTANVTCFNSTTKRIHVSPVVGYNLTKEQGRIAHEVGHAMWDLRNGSQATLYNYDADPNNCGPEPFHELNTKEWQSTAIQEALGWFYAAVAFNDDAGQDACELASDITLLDWNRNGSNDLVDKINCAGSIIANNGTVLTNATNYYGQYCSAGADVNRAVEIDWLRLLWKLRTVHTFDRTDFEAMVEGANPHSWVFAAVSNADTSPADGTPDDLADRPYERMRTGTPAGKRSTFAAQAAVHGVDQ
jgi:hypothetical protein